MPASFWPCWWVRFWHTPVRAERLALMRILVAFFLLTDQLLATLPHFADFYGPEGVAYAGLHDRVQLQYWRWTVLFFNTDNLAIMYAVFGLWVAVTFLFLIGWKTRFMGVAVWFLTMCFINRNPNLQNGGDDILQMALFLLLFGRTGNALSVDAWLARRAGKPLPTLIPAWPLRLIQIELSMIYCTTGLVKLCGNMDLSEVTWSAILSGEFEGTVDTLFQGTWWDGTAVHYTLNHLAMTRWSFAQLPLPFWLTAMLTYVSVWWETLFPLLMLHRWTRYPALIFGVLFHLGIYFTIDIGWFSFYTLSFYAVWVPCSFWVRWDRKREQITAPGAVWQDAKPSAVEAPAVTALVGPRPIC